MAASSCLMLRVIVDARTTRKIALASYPEAITDDLKNVLREKLDLDKNFSIQYEDPDFDGQLVS